MRPGLRKAPRRRAAAARRLLAPWPARSPRAVRLLSEHLPDGKGSPALLWKRCCSTRLPLRKALMHDALFLRRSRLKRWRLRRQRPTRMPRLHLREEVAEVAPEAAAGLGYCRPSGCGARSSTQCRQPAAPEELGVEGQPFLGDRPAHPGLGVVVGGAGGGSNQHRRRCQRPMHVTQGLLPVPSGASPASCRYGPALGSWVALLGLWRAQGSDAHYQSRQDPLQTCPLRRQILRPQKRAGASACPTVTPAGFERTAGLPTGRLSEVWAGAPLLKQTTEGKLEP